MASSGGLAEIPRTLVMSVISTPSLLRSAAETRQAVSGMSRFSVSQCPKLLPGPPQRERKVGPQGHRHGWQSL